jgi:YbbR domain-containing protein
MLAFITENLGWKLLSLFAAVLVWVAVASEPELETAVNAPVEYRNSPRDLEISSEIASTVRLELSGVGGRLRSFASGPDPVLLDFSSVKAPGERTFNIDAQTVRLPRGVQFVRAVPAQLRFRFEKRESREVPVEVRWSGNLPKGLHLSRVEVTPERLTIVGPQSHIDMVQSVRTDPIDLSAAHTGEEFTAAPFIDEPQVRFQNFQPVRVRVILNN